MFGEFKVIKQRLTPVKFLYYKNWKAFWLFKCECGNEIERSMNTFKTGNTKSCGCLVALPPVGGRIKDYSGTKFGRLTAIERFRKRNKSGTSLIWYKCLCDCGNNVDVPTGRLTSGNTKSCGCIDKENLIKRNKDPISISKRSHKMNKKYTVNHWKTNELIYCTGSWEYGAILYFNRNFIDFQWQIAFDLPNNTRYICDIYLPNENKYIEIKGRWMKDAWNKLQLFRETNPTLVLEIWDRPKLFLLNIINNQGTIINYSDKVAA